MPVLWSCTDDPQIVSHKIHRSARSLLFSSEPELILVPHAQPAQRTLDKPKHSNATIELQGRLCLFRYSLRRPRLPEQAFECCLSRAAVISRIYFPNPIDKH